MCITVQSASMSGQAQPSSAFQVPLPHQPAAARPGGGEVKPAAGRDAGGAAASEEAGRGGGRRRTARPRKTTRSAFSSAGRSMKCRPESQVYP